MSGSHDGVADSSGPAMFSGGRCLGYFIATSPVERSVVFRPDEIKKK